jgi:hypothetical protein
MDRGKQRETFDSVVGVTAEIRPGHLPTTRQKRYRFANWLIQMDSLVVYVLFCGLCLLWDISIIKPLKQTRLPTKRLVNI